MKRCFLAVFLGTALTCMAQPPAAPAMTTVSPDSGVVGLGDVFSFEVKADGKAADCATLTLRPKKIGSWMTATAFTCMGGTLTFTAPVSLDLGIPKANVDVDVMAAGATVPATIHIQVVDAKAKTWEARAIVGYHQAGAASADFTQNFFFDFFIMRALHSGNLWGEEVPNKKKGGIKYKGDRWNAWGDVRIASSPQQITSGVGTFATDFANQVAQLPVNRLAQSADVESGMEYRVHTWGRGSAGGAGQRMLGAVGFVGAAGTFETPQSRMQIFKVPDKSSQQYPAFSQQYSSVVGSGAAYVGFVPPNRERFYRSYGFGLRLTSFDKAASLAPPAMYTVTVGQDEQITGGSFRGTVGRFDTFYPLPIDLPGGKYKFIYLFGTASLRLKRATTVPTFALQAPTAADDIQPYDPRLAVVTVASTRDTYRIGVGVDLVNLIQSVCISLNKCTKP